MYMYTDIRKGVQIMDKNPKHPLKKKKAVQKVCATANHNAQEVEAAVPKSKKHTYQSE